MGNTQPLPVLTPRCTPPPEVPPLQLSTHVPNPHLKYYPASARVHYNLNDFLVSSSSSPVSLSTTVRRPPHLRQCAMAWSSLPDVPSGREGQGIPSSSTCSSSLGNSSADEGEDATATPRARLVEFASHPFNTSDESARTLVATDEDAYGTAREATPVERNHPITRLVRRSGLTARLRSISFFMLSPRVHDGRESSVGGVKAVSPRGPGRLSKRSRPSLQEVQAVSLQEAEKYKDEDDKQCERVNANNSLETGSQRRIRRRLQNAARKRSSGWTVISWRRRLSSKQAEGAGRDHPHQRTPSMFNLRRWSSLRSSLSGATSNNSPALSWVPRIGAKSARPSGTTVDSAASCTSSTGRRQGSTGSLNSLTDGRTPWPVSWIEALFLPDFPNRAAVSEKDFFIQSRIARGAFGEVYRARLRQDLSQMYAIKIQKKSSVIANNAVSQVKQEVSIHYSLSTSPFITQLHFAWQNRRNLYMVLRYVSSVFEDLYDLWRDRAPLTERVVAVYVSELGCALDYIHACSVIFRDLKMENVLLDADGHIQIIDFGLAKWLAFGDRTHTICGTLEYMAPEIYTGQPYDHSSDWWSLGALAHALLTKQYPFVTGTNHLNMPVPQQYIPPAYVSREAASLLSKLLNLNPHRRLASFELLKREPFLTQHMDVERIELKQAHPFDLIRPSVRSCDTCNTSVVDEDEATAFRENYDDFRTFDLIIAEDGEELAT